MHSIRMAPTQFESFIVDLRKSRTFSIPPCIRKYFKISGSSVYAHLNSLPSARNASSREYRSETILHNSSDTLIGVGSLSLSKSWSLLVSVADTTRSTKPTLFDIHLLPKSYIRRILDSMAEATRLGTASCVKTVTSVGSSSKSSLLLVAVTGLLDPMAEATRSGTASCLNTMSGVGSSSSSSFFSSRLLSTFVSFLLLLLS
mmetsp:Transcript_35159/g.39214  ORF Transcript_35159/g.39214 Transcript_35159/m.39214 type:complete len:202 (+) Transcript_35159:810-1415(+)